MAAASEAAAAAGRQPSALARPARLLAVLLLLACAAGPPGGAAQQLTDGQLAVVEQQCPVSLQYAVSFGQSDENSTRIPQVPIFVAGLTLQNNANYTIEEWRLGWHFPYGSIIKAQQDVFDSEIMLLAPGSVTTALATDSMNRTIEPGGQLLFSFLANKGTGELNASNPYNVGAIQGVTFNNLRCSMVMAAPQPQAPPALPPAAEAAAQPTDLQIEYTPIEYLGQPMVATFIQFLVRARNIRNESALSMADTSMQYWFDGPVEGAPLFAYYNPEQLFTVQCEWASTGCDSVGLSVQSGLPNTPGASFLLNITWNSKAGLLLPTGDASVPSIFLGKGVDVMDLLVTLTTKQGVALLNSTQDYSFMETPELSVNTTSTIIPRRALPNPRIPAFLDGRLVWGQLPSPPANASMPAAMAGGLGGRSGTAMAMGGNGSGNGSMAGLPAGITCESGKDGKGQNCGLMAVYCCQGPDEVTPFIPEQPPSPAPETVVGVESIHQLQPAMETGPGTTAPSLTPPPPSSGNGSAPVAAPASSQKSSSTGMVAGIAGGVAAAVAVAAALGFFMLRRKRRHQQQIKDRRLLEAAQSEAAAKAEADSGKDQDGHSTPGNGSGTAGGGRHAHFAAAGLPIGAAWKGAAANGNGDALMEVVVPGARGRHLWGAPPSELGSAASSPSKVGSLVPLLRSAPSARSGLLKFPSGVSAVSSHDNPVYEDALWGAAPTQQSVLPQHVGSWELQSQVFTQQAMAQAQAAAAAAVAAAQHQQQQQQQGEEDEWRPDVLAMMERKGATAPTLLVEPRPEKPRRPRRQRSSGGGGGSSDEGGSSSSDGEDEDDSFSSGGSSGPADWQVRRSKSWDGHLQDTSTLGDSLPLFMRRRRAQPTQLLQALPPLAPLAPPVLPSSQPAPDVDLNVDYQSEVAPYLGRCLGQGGFGTVYEAVWRGKRVAVKKLPHFGPDQPCSEGMYAALLREIELASKFSSERLVKVYGACTADREHVCLIMELMEGGNLFQRIYDRCKRRMSYLEILQLAHDVAAGLAYLHPSVVHRDLKPQNILLDAEGRAKLADFGISRVKDPTKSYLSQVTNDNGTPMYMAPEQFNGSRVDEKVDVYALGIILNECYTRRQPWRDSSHFFQIILKVAINGERPWVDPDCPEPLRRLITKCWHQDPHMRPSCAEVMRLTAFMIQEEVHRWEQLQSAGGGHVRLPTAARPCGGLGGGHHHHNNNNGGFRRTSLQAPLPTIPSGEPTQLGQQGPQHAQQAEQQAQAEVELVQPPQQPQQQQAVQPSGTAASLPTPDQQAAQQSVRQGSDSPPPAPTPEQAPQPGQQWQQQ